MALTNLLNVWIYGEGNGRRVAEAHEASAMGVGEYILWDKTRPQTSALQLNSFLTADLAALVDSHHPVPDVVIIGYAGGGASLCSCTVEHNFYESVLDSAVGEVLNAATRVRHDLFATPVLTRGPGVGARLADNTDKQAVAACLENAYEYFWGKLYEESLIRHHWIDWRSNRGDAGVWDTDLVHFSQIGARQVARRIERYLLANLV